ncbi:putative thiosulfate sulfurtransferase [Zalerion maritima]|uniref:Thiosulfate sulfurtransferase n=1 Tax=Zalerion maritima TaxID=339359 RepID=A0AAD5WNK9_9PEZI|nr:putative thiosulfate sulfurtransferase [Zalerion maritima]
MHSRPYFLRFLASISISVSIPTISALRIPPRGGRPLQPPSVAHPLSRIVSPVTLSKALEHGGTNPNISPIVAVDIRTQDSFAESHIPGSISLPFSGTTSIWSTTSEDDDGNTILINFPSSESLFPALSAAGITKEDSHVVVVGDNGTHGAAAASRAALTLSPYAGMKAENVGILNGGFEGWASGGFEVETDSVHEEHRASSDWDAKLNDSFVVSMQFVLDHLPLVSEKSAMLLDARPEEAYNGSVQQDLTAKLGHIPGAVSVPASLLFTDEADGGKFLDGKDLKSLVGSKVNRYFGDGDKGIVIAYCRTGVLASSWTWVLSNIGDRWRAGENIFLYDGSAQEWSMHQDMVV